MKGIVWLASYPKSGNTWFRVFLSNLLRDGEEPADINELESSPIASARELFDDLVGMEASDLSAEEIDRLRPELYRHLAMEAREPLFMKIHDAYTEVEPGLPLIPASATGGALYFLRNPLDVAVSLAHHNGTDCDKAIECMADAGGAFCNKPLRLHSQLRQRLLSWGGHASSWLDAAPFPVCLLRYEDMKAEPLETFTRAVRFLGLPHSPEQIAKAIRFSSFEELRQQEDSKGFKERSLRASRFFRKGKIGSWREELSEAQIERILRDHGAAMRRFGYLDAQGGLLG